MIETQGKLLFVAFFTLLLGVVLIQPIADDIELAKLSFINISNESVTLSVVTADITNESNTLVLNATTLSNNYLTTLSALRNISSEDLITFCNVTLASGDLTCNATGSTTIYADYTFNQHSTGALDNDELISFNACRNSTMANVLTSTHCNATLTSGAVKVNYDNFTDNLAYIDYKYEPDTYVSSSTARVLLTQTTLFFAIAVLVIGVGFAIAAFKQGGVM